MRQTMRKLPEPGGCLFLTDGDIDTTLIVHEGRELPIGEAFVLLESARGRGTLSAYFDRHIALAVEHHAGFVLESPTWRANPDWAAKAGYDRERIAGINRSAIRLMKEIRARHAAAGIPIVISGCVGPRGDGYDPATLMGQEEARAYHAFQVGLFKEEGADLVSAVAMTRSNEALGIARAARQADIPVVVSFTLGIDGRLPSGEKLMRAIEKVDVATEAYPAFYMINCSHPSHFELALDPDAAWTRRIGGLRANASHKSHQELDGSPELDAGDPVALGREYAVLLQRFPQLSVLGGCCSTDHRLVGDIGRSCMAGTRLPAAPPA